MNNRITRNWFAVALAGAALWLAAPASAQNGPWWRTQQPSQPAPAVLTAEEVQMLVFMREEEKLARDVYMALYEKWQLPVFERIAKSEQRHFDAVGRTLARYSIEDPVKEDKPGVFANAELAAMYAELMAKGSVSAEDALKVGQTIEKEDIADLEDALKATQRTDLKRLFSNLLQGSLRHMEAFEANLSGTCLNTIRN